MLTKPTNIRPFTRDLEEHFSSLFPKWMSSLNPLLGNVDQVFDLENSPKINLVKNNDGSQYLLQIQAPGYEKDEIDVNINEQGSQPYLTVKAEHKEENKDKGQEYLYQNISSSAFEVSYPITRDYEIGECELKNGILNIEFNRKNIPEENFKRIEVK